MEGLNWMLRCYYGRRGCILADEMGLGKTAQVIALLEHLHRVEGVRGPFLCVVPLSTIEHWRRELSEWTELRTCVYHDTGTSAGLASGREMRDLIREYEWYWKERSRRLLKWDVLLTTYDDLIRDFESLMQVPFHSVVVDEAHRLRSQGSRLLQCLRDVLPRGQGIHGYQQRVLLTGTPLQNKTEELYTLLNFIEEEAFGDAEDFLERFGRVESRAQVLDLQRAIEPHLLRRVKEDVAQDIPPKEETVIDVELTTLQKSFYRAIFEKNHAFLFNSRGASAPKLLNVHMQLRKVCNHPFLVSGVEDLRMDELEANLEEDLGPSGTPAERERELLRLRLEGGVVAASGKMVLLDKLLPKLRREGHRVLVFSQFVRMLDLLEELMDARGFNCERLDGNVTGNERQKAIDRFNTRADAFCFLLSTRAGGVGINLTAADTVIIFDSDWNPQNDVQAMARCHRIGQTKDVRVYRLITRRSFEAEMFERASRKLGLEQAILGSGAFDGGDQGTPGGEVPPADPSKMSAEDMEALLRKGAYHLLDADTKAADDFVTDDIDSILEKRSRVLVVEGGASQGKALRARKARFAAASDGVDLHDPDFWRKLMPDMISPEMLLDRLETLGKEEEEGLEERSEAFMGDLVKMTASLCDRQDAGRLGEEDKHAALTLLLRVSMREDLFNGAERKTAEAWAEALEGDRRRNRRGRSTAQRRGAAFAYGSDDAYSDAPPSEESSDEDAPPRNRRAARKPKGSGPRTQARGAPRPKKDSAAAALAKRVRALRSGYRREQLAAARKASGPKARTASRPRRGGGGGGGGGGGRRRRLRGGGAAAAPRAGAAQDGRDRGGDEGGAHAAPEEGARGEAAPEAPHRRARRRAPGDRRGARGARHGGAAAARRGRRRGQGQEEGEGGRARGERGRHPAVHRPHPQREAPPAPRRGGGARGYPPRGYPHQGPPPAARRHLPRRLRGERRREEARAAHVPRRRRRGARVAEREEQHRDGARHRDQVLRARRRRRRAARRRRRRRRRRVARRGDAAGGDARRRARRRDGAARAVPRRPRGRRDRRRRRPLARGRGGGAAGAGEEGAGEEGGQGEEKEGQDGALRRRAEGARALGMEKARTSVYPGTPAPSPGPA